MIISKHCKIFLLILAICLSASCSSKKDALKKTSEFDSKDAFLRVEEKMKKRRFDQAREILDEIRAKDTTGEFAVLAQLRTGDTYYKEEHFTEAAVEYERFLNLHAYHTYAAYAQYQLAMTYFKRIKTVDISYELTQQALTEFRKLLKVYPRNPYVDIVENRIRTCENMLAEYEFYVGKFYYKKGSYSAAASRFEEMIRSYPGTMKESDALFYLGMSYKKTGDLDRSLKAFRRLIEQYPATSLSKDAEDIIASLQEKAR